MFRFSESLGPGRNKDNDVDTILAVPVVSFAMAAPLRLENPLVLEMEQSIDPLGALDIDVSSFSAISAARPSFGYKFLSSEGETPVASASGGHMYCCTINEQGQVPVLFRPSFGE